MNKIKLVIRELHRSERNLANQLRRMSDRHHTEHEIHHLARDLADWSQHHVSQLARLGRNYGMQLPTGTGNQSDRLATTQRTTARLLGRRPAPALVLLADLRRIHRKAAGVSLDWVLLAQAGQAARQQELLQLAQQCHPDTLRQERWANAKLKELAGQTLTGP